MGSVVWSCSMMMTDEDSVSLPRSLNRSPPVCDIKKARGFTSAHEYLKTFCLYLSWSSGWEPQTTSTKAAVRSWRSWPKPRRSSPGRLNARWSSWTNWGGGRAPTTGSPSPMPPWSSSSEMWVRVCACNVDTEIRGTGKGGEKPGAAGTESGCWNFYFVAERC